MKTLIELDAEIARLQAERELLLPFKNGEFLWCVNIDGVVSEIQWHNYPYQQKTNDFIGYFKSESEAIARRDLVREFIQNLKKDEKN